MTTKEEPKECLLTFVEIFILKFLSDNLPTRDLPAALSFYELIKPEKDFVEIHGMAAIEYYVSKIRPQIKRIFPDNAIAQDPRIGEIFGLKTVVSKTSIINGFAFLKTSDQSVASYDTAFRDILGAFQRFGPLTNIDPEFKLRLYEMFLKRSMRQQTLGQFFTPRNIVRSMIRMACLHKLPDGAVLLDPAAGPGGFVLEPLLLPGALQGNLRFESGKPVRRVRTIGVDVDQNTHILAKANTLIHLAEAVRDPKTTVAAMNTAMAETFVLMNGNQTLGAPEYPPRSCVDVILTNPPYVTSGSSVYRKAVEAVQGERNGVRLRTHHDRTGLGLEAYFLRYISGALKPGARAFIVVPLGLLNRVESGPKAKLLDECNIIASVQLPRNAFFNTAQKTYVLALEKRHTQADARPDVFCAVTRSIGETLDYLRMATLEDNDFAALAEMFVGREEGDAGPALASPLVKIIQATEFEAHDRWDLAHFWSDEEKVALKLRDPVMERSAFIDDVQAQLQDIVGELDAARAEIAELISGPMATARLDNTALFRVRAGTRIRAEDIAKNKVFIPVYSCFRNATLKKGDADETWLSEQGAVIEEGPVVTVNANGKSIGLVFVRRDRCAITDDVVIVEVLPVDLDHNYVAARLRTTIAAGNYEYEAKLFKGRVEKLAIDVPVSEDGSLDIEQQKKIASAMNRFGSIRERLAELGKFSAEARVA